MISIPEDLDYYYETFTVTTLQLHPYAYNIALLESGLSPLVVELHRGCKQASHITGDFQ